MDQQRFNVFTGVCTSVCLVSQGIHSAARIANRYLIAIFLQRRDSSNFMSNVPTRKKERRWEGGARGSLRGVHANTPGPNK
jgi:hypothetical protein